MLLTWTGQSSAKVGSYIEHGQGKPQLITRYNIEVHISLGVQHLSKFPTSQTLVKAWNQATLRKNNQSANICTSCIYM